MCSIQNPEMEPKKMNILNKSLTYNFHIKVPNKTGFGTLLIFVIFFLFVTQNGAEPLSMDSSRILESTKFQNFSCPDSDDKYELDVKGEGHRQAFCKSGMIPRQQTLNIHSDDLDKLGNFSLNTQNFKERRVCVKSFEDEQITIIRCDVQQNKITSGQFSANDGVSNSNSNLAPSNVLILRKCCPLYQRLVKTNSTEHAGMLAYICVPTAFNWNPALFSDVESDFSKHIDLRSIQKQIVPIPGFPICKNSTKLMDNYEDIGFKILSTTGQVFIGLKFWFKPVWLLVHDDKQNQLYCLDELETPLDTDEENNSDAIHHKNQVLAYCEIERFDDYLFHRKLFGILCCSASCAILLLLIIYLSIYDRQNLAGWTQFNIFVAVFFVFGMEGVRTLINYNGLDVKATVSCTVVAAIAQYFFFALNTTWFIMNMDLSWTFWKLESSAKGLKGKGLRICAYLTFSWVLPLVIILIGFGFKHHQANESKGNMNGFYSEAHRRCSSPIREFGFQTLGVMFLCNTVFFAITAMLIWKHRRGMTNSRRNSRTERYTWRSNAVFGRVILFGKLFLVMGVAEITIPLNFFFGSDDPLNPFEVLFRMVHFIPVVAILFIFGFNDKNMHLIKQKYPNFGTVMGMKLFSRNRATTETNPSPSGGQNSTEIK